MLLTSGSLEHSRVGVVDQMAASRARIKNSKWEEFTKEETIRWWQQGTEWVSSRGWGGGAGKWCSGAQELEGLYST